MQWYRVKPGVEWVNGARVPADGRVRLSAAEAAYDLALGRIMPDKPATTRRGRRGK